MALISDAVSYQHFELVCGHPETHGPSTVVDQLSMSDALEEVFLTDTNLLIMQWNGVFVPLSYRYDVSWIIVEAVEMVEKLIAAPDGTVVDVRFPSNTFNVGWEITVRARELSIEATWDSVIGSLTDLLRARSPLRIGLADFTSEWRHLFAVVDRAMTETQLPVSLVDDYDRLANLALFKDTASRRL